MGKFEKFLMAFISAVFSVATAEVLSQRFFPANINSS